jgi:putative transposase
MKKREFSEIEIISILKQQVTGESLQKICSKYGISETTFRNWKTLYGKMKPGDVKQMKAQQDEYSKLRRIITRLTSGKIL